MKYDVIVVGAGAAGFGAAMGAAQAGKKFFWLIAIPLREVRLFSAELLFSALIFRLKNIRSEAFLLNLPNGSKSVL